MMDEEFRKLVQAKIRQTDLPQYVDKIADIIHKVYINGLSDGMELARELRQQYKDNNNK